MPLLESHRRSQAAKRSAMDRFANAWRLPLHGDVPVWNKLHFVTDEISIRPLIRPTWDPSKGKRIDTRFEAPTERPAKAETVGQMDD